MKDLEQILGYQFKDENLLRQALTHKSFANEQKLDHNEKLEFLGDAVLDLVIADFLYHKFSEDTEGGLSKKRASIVNEQVLSQIGLELKLNQVLKLGKGELQTGGATKPRLLASSFEALVGAVYLDADFEITKNVICRHLAPVTESVCGAEDYERDYKTRLQEWAQKNFKETPRYEVVSEEGPPHDRHFFVSVTINDKVWAQGRGRSKKIAEQEAAKVVLIDKCNDKGCKENSKDEL